VSRLKKDGRIHLFRHYNQDTENPFVWGGRYDAIDDQLDPIRPSDASDSLLRSLLSGPAVSDMLLYSRPSAWADLEISRTYVNSGGGPIRLNSVRLEMVYDFTPRSTGSGLRDLEVLVQTLTEGPGGEPIIEDSSFMPYMQLGAVDVNGRSDARGSFLRVFQSGEARSRSWPQPRMANGSSTDGPTGSAAICREGHSPTPCCRSRCRTTLCLSHAIARWNRPSSTPSGSSRRRSLADLSFWSGWAVPESGFRHVRCWTKGSGRMCRERKARAAFP
jgi:hypothetical protein